MTKKHRKTLARILIGAALLIIIEASGAEGALKLGLFLAPYAVVGWDVVFRAARSIRNGQIFNENFLMTVATIGAFGCGEYPEGVAVMLFYQVGELFQSMAVSRSRQSIAALMDIRPDYANVERGGTLVQTPPDEVTVGEVIVVKPGERIPLDGVIVQGASSLDTAALTGESLPRDVVQGEDVISGCINLTGVLRVEVRKLFEESTVSKILELVEHSAGKKAKAEHFITKFARYYTPAVVLAALALALIPPLAGMGPFGMWLRRSLIFLVVSCPCALVISIPLGFFGGIGGASKQGILVKGGNYLEALAEAGIVVFDKTGTLTRGVFAVDQIHPVGMEGGELLALTALAEQWSDHPISKSIRAAAPERLELARATGAEEIAGRGIKAVVDGKTVWAGNAKLMELAGVSYGGSRRYAGTIVHVAVDGAYAGHIVVADQLKQGAEQMIQELKAAGVRKAVMLTGDTSEAGEEIARTLRLDEVHAGLLPGNKVDCVERLLKEKRQGERLIFVGDGINDAPVLSRADVGVAMGAMGSDAAIEAADVVLMDDDLFKLAVAVRIARKTLRIVRQNIVFALGVKFLVLGLSAFGWASMWMAVFADVGVSVIAIANAGRMLRAK